MKTIENTYNTGTINIENNSIELFPDINSSDDGMEIKNQLKIIN